MVAEKKFFEKKLKDVTNLSRYANKVHVIYSLKNKQGVKENKLFKRIRHQIDKKVKTPQDIAKRIQQTTINTLGLSDSEFVFIFFILE